MTFRRNTRPSSQKTWVAQGEARRWVRANRRKKMDYIASQKTPPTQKTHLTDAKNMANCRKKNTPSGQDRRKIRPPLLQKAPPRNRRKKHENEQP